MTLGLCMIVKNESKVLERALENVATFADEIVIVDTGSTDNTVEIARKFTDKVYIYEWNDNFSSARNFALSQVESDYWMWLDADDMVPIDTATGIAEFMRTSDASVDVAMLPYIVETTSDGKPIFSYYRERILKNKSGFLWEGRVHEVVQPRGNIARLPFPIVHSKPKDRRSGTRNLDIYRAAVASGDVLSARERYYFARELFYNGFISQSIDEFKNFLDMPNGFYVNKIDACIMLARCYLQTKDIDSALSAAFQSFVYGLPTGEACCEIGNIYLSNNDYGKAAYWYECATRATPDIDSGAFVDFSAYGFTPYVWLTVCYDRLGDVNKAYEYHLRAKKLRPDHQSVVFNQAYFERLGYK
ncbi:MAG: glycosyltransferase [Clostridia bacterium]|nr:glycosyltransferase [Clostridia bacterium]